MATAASSTVYNLVKVGTLELDHEGDEAPNYSGLTVLSPNLLVLIDQRKGEVRLHNLQDGQLLHAYTPESNPVDISVCYVMGNEINVAVTLADAAILILHINSTNKILTLVRKIDLSQTFDHCHGIKYLSGNLAVSGLKRDKVYWGTVSITDGQVVTFNKICRQDGDCIISLTVHPRDEEKIFIACDAGGAYYATDNYEGEEYPASTGVYGFQRSERTFFYSDDDLKEPRSITVDKYGYIFVVNEEPACIHHLTEKGQILTIYREGIPSSPTAIFWEAGNGELYLAVEDNNTITTYKPVYPHAHVTSLRFACRDAILQQIQEEDIESLTLPTTLKQFLRYES